MARDEDDEAHWGRQLLIGVGALVVGALVIGGVASVLALGAAKVSGIGDSSSQPSSSPSLYIPSGTPSVKLEQNPAPDGVASGTPSPTTSPTTSPTASPPKRTQTISLQGFPQQVAANGRINLTGLFIGGAGATLKVQRLESGAWTDFPVAVQVSNGQFATFVTTGRTGLNRFRVVTRSGAATSNVIRITVG